jgi:hypothetical protein
MRRQFRVEDPADALMSREYSSAAEDEYSDQERIKIKSLSMPEGCSSSGVLALRLMPNNRSSSFPVSPVE